MKTRQLTLEHVAIAAVVAIGMAATAGPVSDNSMFTHLRTGIDIAESGHIPRTDPYSFTAMGEPWVVQSWFAVLTYGLAYLAGGVKLVIFEQMVLTGLIAFIMALLCRTGSMARTVAAVTFPIVLGYLTWSHRPLLFGVLGLAIVVLVVEKRHSPWWLVPVGWIWVNSHGSFPVGIGYLVLVIAGSWLDTRSFDRKDIRYLAFFVGGLLAGAINPLGPKLLTFWTVAIGDRGEGFTKIIEWRSPDFHSAGGFVLAVAVVMSIAIATRARAEWRYTLPAVVFLVFGLYSFRHLAMYAVVICPWLAAALRPKETPEPSAVSKIVVRAAFVSILALIALMSARVATSEPFDEKTYPVAALEWIEKNGLHGPEHHMVSRDTTGNFLEYRYGRDARVFIDDRVDMYPASVFRDYVHLHMLDEDPEAILQRYGADVVLWERGEALTQFLRESPKWSVGFEDKEWTVFVRRP